MTANKNMGRAFKEARALIRQRAVEYPESHETAKCLWRLLLDNPDDAVHVLSFMVREADPIGRIEEREAILDVLRHIPQSSLRYSASESSSAEGPCGE